MEKRAPTKPELHDTSNAASSNGNGISQYQAGRGREVQVSDLFGFMTTGYETRLI